MNWSKGGIWDVPFLVDYDCVLLIASLSLVEFDEVLLDDDLT